MVQSKRELIVGEVLQEVQRITCDMEVRQGKDRNKAENSYSIREEIAARSRCKALTARLFRAKESCIGLHHCLHNII